ncbi:uncharacterized protein LOC126336614 [Schistocerca gregaria]|uniref:uncharacterized protein LOC126336614 n=1 Tax=Schistocerca gregaria TaxID=7010 RepID=UPI00211F0D29|nr:uncharacterized protein LOC126336614 [Schistocerca gregaria]
MQLGVKSALYYFVVSQIIQAQGENTWMHKSKSGASAQAAYAPQVYWFQMLKFLDQATEADESVCNLESTEIESKRATPTFEEMCEHEMQEPVACSEAQPQPQRQERPPTKRRKVTPDVATNVMEEASRTLKGMADAARTMPVHEDRYSTLGAHIAAELREMEKVGGREYTTATMHGLERTLMDRWDNLHATARTQLSTSGYIQAALQQAGIEEDDSIL